MKDIIGVIIVVAATLPALMNTFPAAAQVPDSISEVKNLKEVVVEAPRVVQKIDKDVYYPTANTKELSADGLQLVQNLRIPTLIVNETMGKVKSLGADVQIRINGRLATIEEVKQLQPEYVKRIEWIDHPGMKYDGAEAVIDVITSNPNAGGSLMVSAVPALYRSWFDGFASLKLNYGRSQWSLGVSEHVTNHLKIHRDYNETFTYPDGSSLTRTETPVDGSVVINFTNPTLAYSYMKPEETLVYVSMTGNKDWGWCEDYTGRMTMSDFSPTMIVKDKTRKEGFTPTLSAYVEQYVGKKQVVSVDVSASRYDGHSYHHYKESPEDDAGSFTDVNTSIHDRNTSFGLTGDYEKEMRTAKLTTGISYWGSRNRSTYENLNDAVYHQTQNRLRFFGEYRKTIINLSVTAGLGAQHSSYRLRESNLGRSSWNLRPRFALRYKSGMASTWNMSFSTYQSTPSLSETNQVEQQIDGFQWQIGNPDLKTYSTYNLDASYRYSGKSLTGAVGIEASTSPHAIAPYCEWRGDRLYTTYENSRGRKYLSAYAAPSIDVIPGWLSINGTLKWGVTRTRGTGYLLTRRQWSGNVSASAYHWGFQLLVNYERQAPYLTGERETWGEEFSLAALGYNYRNWQFWAQVFCPFTKYDQGARLMSRYNSNEKHMRLDIAPMPMIRVCYNLQWGRQKGDVNKRAEADSSIESTSVGSR